MHGAAEDLSLFLFLCLSAMCTIGIRLNINLRQCLKRKIDELISAACFVSLKVKSTREPHLTHFCIMLFPMVAGGGVNHVIKPSAGQETTGATQGCRKDSGSDL